MAIINATIGTSTAAAYTSSGNNAITTVIVCNTATFNPSNPTSGLTYLYLYAVPSGGDAASPATNTLIVNGLPVPAGETVSLDQEKMVLSSGDMLVAKSGSPANLVVTVSTLPV
ncbi:hypothetical protein UFOVP181_353 [uncultured Caudovirales phage]|uniref:Uncharacterized protein n=1 Tax=uncultured Caudovirales phage TaxID=2100421 RepID=A0A6J5KXD0_9CAUD|nr:hypothetical protein UFOVP57_286 [uncultured Caudovirales phage]CAB5209196.1 hypothetical protein UFOVP181_353 [uncultured Caudovirales phage]